MGNIQKFINLRRCMKNQWLKTSQLEELQFKMLKSILNHSYKNIPLYHQKFKEAGLYPADIKSLDDMKKIPITTKQDIKDHYPQGTIARGVDTTKCWKPHTSGSTGKPLTMVYCSRDEDYQKAIALRPNLACGQKVRDKWAVITASYQAKPKKWFQKLRIFAPEYISLFDEVNQQISFLEKFNPKILDGYATSIFLLAKKLQDQDHPKINPKIIFVTAEMLMENMRKTIESTFQQKIYDQFGCVELGRTAWECPEHSGYHMDMDSVFMEFIKNGEEVSPGERGEIIYTGLYNYTMPLIRYSIGDVAIPSDEKCNCGRGLKLMESVEGRKDSFIQTPSGKIYSPIIWTIILRPFSQINQFRVTQEKIDHITIEIAKTKDFTDETLTAVKERIDQYLGQEDVHFEFVLVDEISRKGNKKLKSVESKLKIKLN